MYMLRLISAVLHKEPGPAVPEAALDLRPAELGILDPARRLPARALGVAGGDQRQRTRGSSETSPLSRSQLRRLGAEPTDDRHPVSRLVRALALARRARRRGDLPALGRAHAALAAPALRGVRLRARVRRRHRHGLPRLLEEPGRAADRRRRGQPRPVRRGRAADRHGLGPAHRRRLVLRAHARGPHRRVLRAAGHGRGGHGLPRPGGQPDDPLPRPRVVLGLPLHPLRDRDRPRRLARGRAQVPDHRRDGLGRAAVRLGARLRLDRRARLRRDRRTRPAPTTSPPIRSSSSASR